MKIVSKEMESDGSQSIIYLVDENGNPLTANIVSKEEKEEAINELLAKHFMPEDWVNNKSDLLKHVEEVSYEEYINQ
jgi:hypothetical protein